MHVEISPEESIFIQSHALAECLVNLGSLEAGGSQKFSELAPKIYGQTAGLIRRNGHGIFQGQGVFVSVFYMFLVLPYEWSVNGVGEFQKLNLSKSEVLAKEIATIQDGYRKKVGVLQHLRNALSHGRISQTGNSFIFNDKNSKGERFTAEFSTLEAGKLVQSLNEEIAFFIQNVIFSRGK